MTTDSQIATSEAESQGSEKPNYLRTCNEILAFLRANQNWYLEDCNGATLNSYWWWVRNSKLTSDVIHCNGNAARSAWKQLKSASPNGAICSADEANE